MALRGLRIAAAYHALGLADAGYVVDAADAALTAGVYSYSLGELGTYRNPTWADCSPLFVAALRELQVPVPDPAAAVETILELHVLRLVEGAAPPQESLGELYSMHCELRDGPPVKVSPAALAPLRPFVDEYHAVEAHRARHGDPLGAVPYRLRQARLDELYAGTIALADDWCRSRWPATDAAWHTSDVLTLARGVAADKAFDRLPILADALQDAGCEDEFILEHLRNDRPHVRCCFAVDLLLHSAPRGTHR